jgi:putative nucleotidyltransferase with HDIG domain
MARNPLRPSNRGHARRRNADQHAAEINTLLHATGAGTAEHSHAVERLALRIADHLGLDAELRRSVGLAARLHDIGKSAIPRSVLEKTAPLSAYEWQMMRDHTVFGEQILRGGSEMDAVASYVRHAHERWDGKGYPDGLTGEQIPLASRIIFCADAYDAICTDRSYRRGASPAEGLAEIRSCSGTQFDPRVVDALARAVRPELYRRSGRVRRRPHARLLSAIVVFSIGAIGTAAAAVTNESGPSLAGPSQVRSAPANALSSTHPGAPAALTPKISTNRGRPAGKSPTSTDGATGEARSGGGRTDSRTGGAGSRPGVEEGAQGGEQGSAPDSDASPAPGDSGDTVVADSGGSTTPPTLALPVQVPALALPDPAALLGDGSGASSQPGGG